MVSTARPPVKYWLPWDLSVDTLTQMTAESTISVWKVRQENTAVQSAQCSKSAMPTVAEAVRAPKTFPDGKQKQYYIISRTVAVIYKRLNGRYNAL